MSAVSEDVTFMPIERTDGTYALRLCLNQGELTAGMLKRIMEVMEEYELVSLRATTGQRMNLEGIPKEQLEEIGGKLGMSVPKAPPGVSVCPGAQQCKYGTQNTREMGDKILALVKENGPYPFKIKSGVSGCKMSCGLSYVRDIGLVGTPRGWDVYFGGCATRNAGLGVQLGTKVTDEEALELLRKALLFYKENGKKRQRTSGLLKHKGADAILDAVK